MANSPEKKICTFKCHLSDLLETGWFPLLGGSDGNEETFLVIRNVMNNALPSWWGVLNINAVSSKWTEGKYLAFSRRAHKLRGNWIKRNAWRASKACLQIFQVPKTIAPLLSIKSQSLFIFYLLCSNCIFVFQVTRTSKQDQFWIYMKIVKN